MDQNKIQDVILTACPLMTAITKNDLESLENLLNQGHNPNIHSSCSNTGTIGTIGTIGAPIFLAVEKNHSDALRLLLRYGADPNVKRDNKMRTAFLTAIYLRHRDCFDLLINALYRPNYKF